jgi:CheY-like chemotaxis protein
MAHVLIVEDSAEQAGLLAGLVEASGFTVETVADGETALEKIAGRRPDIVATDLMLPGITGLDVVDAVKRDYPMLPIVLMTAFGSGEIAARALKAGAASYVPKRNVHSALIPTLRSTLTVARAQQEQQRVLQQLRSTEYEFALPNDAGLIPPLVSFVQQHLREVGGQTHETELMQTGIALHESLVNAMHHGNLEVDSSLRERDDDAYRKLISQRQKIPPYRDRRVRFRCRISREELRCVILDEGPGFDPKSVPDPTDTEHLERISGRGLYLIGTFMDRVAHNDKGNEITLVKELAPRASAA